MVAEKKECGGSEIYKGYLESVEACGSICRGVASMFIFGIDSSCNSEGCFCYCETSAANQGTCDMSIHIGFRLYKYISGNYHTLL